MVGGVQAMRWRGALKKRACIMHHYALLQRGRGTALYERAALDDAVARARGCGALIITSL
jgi:hypothetical protein